ncbi:Ran GTPase-activating protein [Wolbachia endosymbiont of Cylisticus convexus]|uniref:leucine-rich repeat domain-containing protein n=1 Tax=Wolbachia endosymbiont of Cylisticus convexus TaxID=118728 RepID=UPI000DF71AD8|nr:leucine-rich repeat domain-containing protein [Wolbachia endosymbiont of Cylisticus convexus]RDD35276.1 Ran GTPase-activating protein [Wolbachia endosymbiont of Cylisticus convexus]
MNFNEHVQGDKLYFDHQEEVDIKKLISFLQKNRNITQLSLMVCGIDEKGAKELAKLTNLTEFNLSYNSIGDEGAKELAKLTNLTELNLDDNKIGDEGAKALAKLTNFTKLSLENNEIGEEGAKALANLTNLEDEVYASSKVKNKQSGACAKQIADGAVPLNVIPVSDGLNASNTDTDPSNFNLEEDLNSSYDLDNSLPFLEGDSSLVEKEIPLTDEESLLNDKFHQKMNYIEEKNKQKYKKIIGENEKYIKAWTKSALKDIKDVAIEYLERGIKLNSYCDDNRTTVVNLIFEKIQGVLEKVNPGREIRFSKDPDPAIENVSIIQNIALNLLLKGGKVQRYLFYNDRMSHATMGFINPRNKGFHEDEEFDKDEGFYEDEEFDEDEGFYEEKQFDKCLFDECKYIMDQLKSAAYESIVNKNKQIQDELEINIDNIYSYIKYPQGSIVEIVKITNELEVEHLELKVCELEIGGSKVIVEFEEEGRNYTDIIGSDGIVLTFYTSLGGLEVRLYPDKEDENLIRVEVRDQGKLKKLKSCNEEIGENCFLGGLSVNKAIEQGYFERPRKLCQSSERVSLSKKIEEGVLEAVRGLQPGDIMNSSSNSCREGYAENQDASMNSSHSVQYSKSRGV